MTMSTIKTRYGNVYIDPNPAAEIKILKYKSVGDIGAAAFYCPYVPVYWISTVKEEHKLHGKLHRVDGPARIYENGKVEWWFFGKDFDFDYWCCLTSQNETDRTKLMLEYMT